MTPEQQNPLPTNESQRPELALPPGSAVWAISEILFVYLACKEGYQGAANIVIFLGALNLFSFFMVLIGWEAMKKIPEKRPGWLLLTLDCFDAAVLGMLAFYGWWWTLLCYCFGFSASVGYRNRHNQQYLQP